MVARLEAHQDGRADVPWLKEIKPQINANKRGSDFQELKKLIRVRLRKSAADYFPLPFAGRDARGPSVRVCASDHESR
jgi:hypothetical protein